MIPVEPEEVVLDRPKRCFNSFAELDELFERDDWPISKPYVEFDLALYLHVWVRPGDLNPRGGHFVAVIQRLPDVELCPIDGADISTPLPVHIEERLSIFRHRHRAKAGNDETMFVLIRQGVQGREEMRSWAVLSTVRLRHLDDPPGVWMDPLDARFKVPAAPVGGVRGRLDVVDRELGSSGGLSLVGNDERPDHVVQGRPEVLDHVAGNQTPERRERPQNLNADVVSRGLLVYLGDETMGLGFVAIEPMKLVVESLQMNYGPVELGP